MSICDPVELGLPINDVSGSRLVFNAATGVLAVQLWVESRGCRWGRLYARLASERFYVPVGAPLADHSDESLIGCEGPFLFFLRRRGELGANGWGFWTDRVVRVALPSYRCHEFIPSGVASHERSVRGLISAAPDGESVHGVVGEYAAATATTHYSVARIELASGAVAPLTHLEGVFV